MKGQPTGNHAIKTHNLTILNHFQLFREPRKIILSNLWERKLVIFSQMKFFVSLLNQ